jgi:hypothetical protein
MRQVPAAILSGYGSPLYPRDEILRLALAFTAQGPAGFSVRTLDVMARGCSGFVADNRLLRTSDGYVWRCIIEFRVGPGKGVAVAIPGTQDWNRRDGVQLDRSPAIYATRDVTEEQAKAVLLAFVRAMDR